jgi:VCBS repeat-containing protein
LSSIHVTVEDDAPVAANDTDTLDTQTLTAEGNVLSGAGTTSGSAGADHFGADGPGSLTAVSGADGSDNTFDGNGNLVVHGAYGTLTIDAQGQYTYVLDNNAQDNVKDVFTYTIVDADGDTSQATLTITVPNLNEPPTAGEGSVHVS